MSYSDIILAKSPLLYWRLNETTPGTGSAADSSGNSRPGTYVASPTSVKGLLFADPDPGVIFNGTSQWITSSYNPFAVAGTLTFECWFKRTTNATNDVVFGGSQPSTQPFLTVNLTSDTVQFNTDAGAAGQTWVGAVAPHGAVYHIVLTFTGSTKTSELWINGVSQGTKVHSTDFNAAPGNFNIGKRSTASDPVDGTVDEVALYGSVLSAAQIRENYRAGFQDFVGLRSARPLIPALRRFVPIWTPVIPTWPGGLEIAAVAGTAWEQPVDDTLALDDLVATSVGRAASVTDSVTMSDALQFDRDLHLADTATMSDALRLDRDLHLADTVSLADSLATARAIALQIDDTVGLADLASTQTGKAVTVTDTVTMSDALTFARDVHIADSLTLADALSTEEQVALAITDTVALADSVSADKSGAKTQAVDDTLALTDALTFARDVHLADTVTLSDALASAAVFTRTVTDTVSLADVATPVKSTSTAWSQPIDDTLSLTDQVTVSAGFSRTVADSVFLSDLVAATFELGQTITDTITVTDTVAVSYVAGLPPGYIDFPDRGTVDGLAAGVLVGAALGGLDAPGRGVLSEPTKGRIS